MHPMKKEEPAFETSLATLERLVAEMESGKLSLDDMMARFEEGKKLVARCTTELESIRQRIEKVTSSGIAPLEINPA